MTPPPNAGVVEEDGTAHQIYVVSAGYLGHMKRPLPSLAFPWLPPAMGADPFELASSRSSLVDYTADVGGEAAIFRPVQDHLGYGHLPIERLVACFPIDGPRQTMQLPIGRSRRSSPSPQCCSGN
jgi:hypothetical protein